MTAPNANLPFRDVNGVWWHAARIAWVGEPEQPEGTARVYAARGESDPGISVQFLDAAGEVLAGRWYPPTAFGYVEWLR